MQHIGNRIKTLITERGSSITEVAIKMHTSYHNLYRLLSRESIETKYISEIANILNVPITSIFSLDEMIDTLNLPSDSKELRTEIDNLKKRISELEKSLEKSEELIEFYKDRINELVMGIVSYKFFLPEDTSMDLTFYGREYEELFKKVGYSKEKTDYVLKILSESKVKIDPK